MTPPIERDNVFQMRLSQLERKMLDAVADGMGLNASDAVRKLVQEKFVAIFKAEIQAKFPKVAPEAMRPDQLTTVAARLGYEIGKALATPKKK